VARKLLGVAILATGIFSQTASAGPYTDDLSKCLVKSSTAGDQVSLVQWMFSAFALHPAVQPYASINQEQRSALNHKMADLTQRLLLEDCRKETIDALKYEGSGAMEAGFAVLGQAAARGLMGDPHVAQGLQGLSTYFDKDKMTQLSKDAGLPQKAAAPAN
jgi:hypothetical protein